MFANILSGSQECPGHGSIQEVPSNLLQRHHMMHGLQNRERPKKKKKLEALQREEECGATCRGSDEHGSVLHHPLGLLAQALSL